MNTYSTPMLESINFNLRMQYASFFLEDKMSPKKNYYFENIKDVSITPWHHNTCKHDWNFSKNSIIFIELPMYDKLFYLINNFKGTKDEFIDNSLDIILSHEKEFNANALRSAYTISKQKGNLILPISKNVSGINREFYLFKNLMFNLYSVDAIYQNNFSRFKNFEIVLGSTHCPSIEFLIKNFSNLNISEKEAVGKIDELSCYEKYENYLAIKSLSLRNLNACLIGISEALTPQAVC